MAIYSRTNSNGTQQTFKVLSVTMVLLAIILSCFFTLRSTEGDGCLTTQNDVGSIFIKQLRESIENAECQLLQDTIYKDYNVTCNEEFDFIIVGAGAGGSVVASRVSENHIWKVLLLEAGGDPPPSTLIPALFGTTLNTKLDWQYRTEPEPNSCLGSVNQSCTWPRGKVIGGSTAINALLYVRGHPQDYDNWENMGNPGWKFKYMLPYFKKSEDMRSEEVSKNENFSKYHNKGGPLKIESFKNNITIFRETFSKAFIELGLGSSNDVNSENHTGFFTLQGTLDNARRCSAAKAFLHEFQTRQNLKISKNSFVRKVLVDKQKGAYGVEFEKGGTVITALATKEIILSAGTINTPQLLMLSGIGPKRHLNEMGITIKKDLNVGRNLQDHSLMRGFIITLNITVPPVNNTESTFQFLIQSQGNFAGVGLFSNAGFLKTAKSSYPNVQMYFTSFPAESTATFKQALQTIGFNEDIQRSLLKINSKKYTLLMMPCLLQPKSKGKILLKTTNPADPPLIYPGYFSNEQDIKVYLEAIEFANKFVNTQSMQRLGAKVERIEIPDCQPFEFQTSSYWECVIKHMSVTVYHPVGTCQMGPRENKDAVVDSRLRVHGIKNLRVIDASIMPNITRGNTFAPTIAVAEKGSDMVKQYWIKKQP